MALTSKKRGVRSAARAPRAGRAGKRDVTKAPELVETHEAEEPPDEQQARAPDKKPGQDPEPALAAASAKRASGKSATKPKALVQRIYDTIDGELTKLEQQDGRSSQDRERASRALAQMVNSLEKAVDMQREIAKPGKGAKSKDKEALAYAEQLREEIAQRLERLTRKRAAGK